MNTEPEALEPNWIKNDGQAPEFPCWALARNGRIDYVPHDLDPNIPWATMNYTHWKPVQEFAGQFNHPAK